MQISCAFATGPRTHEHIVIAEALGYERAWCYDSPALYPDVWVMLALAAERTSRIGLGPGVLIPSLRHPMVNAAAAATLEMLAPGRVVLAVGSGFTGRLTMGQRPLKWRWVREYVRVLRALLRGETVEWEGAAVRMIHPAGFVADRPLNIPVLIGAGGPRGFEVANQVGDGAFIAGGGLPEDQRGRITWVAALINGTVLAAGEEAGSERSLAAAGHGAAVAFHGAWERGRLDALPDGAAWLARLEQVPERERHLAVHEGHLVAPSAIDRPFVTGELLKRTGRALPAAEWRTKLQALEAAGVTEIAYQPAGADIPRELEAFMQAARS